MAEQPVPLIYNNVLPWRGCEKLYLDTRTADVFFMFKIDDENTVKIPAHKNILSANSDAFDAMFYGSRKQEGDIPIVDSTPEAFMEFLQFFYLRSVKLTDENVAHVMNLGKQYMVDKCCMAISDFTEQTLTLDTMCWGYELAILFDQRQLTKFCEQKIGQHPKEIFESSSFLSCGSNLLARILQLDTLNCDESVVFDGCMAWAKAACIRNGLDETNMQNIRTQLGDLFYEIRFGDMTAESFYPLYNNYKKLFSMKEFEDIFGMIASKEHCPAKFNRNARKAGQIRRLNMNELICDRTDAINLKSRYYELYEGGSNIYNNMSLTSNRKLLLKTICCVELFQAHYDKKWSVPFIPATLDVMSASDGTLLQSEQVNFHPLRETVIHFPTPIVIHPGVKYELCFRIYVYRCFFLIDLKKNVQMDDGIEIEFGDAENNYKPNPGVVKKIIFVKPEE